MLQCHPHPCEFVDDQRKGRHTAFFMGLRQKQCASCQPRTTLNIAVVEEFKREVEWSATRKETMKIHVSLMKQGDNHYG